LEAAGCPAMPELAEIFRAYGPRYLEEFADRMPPSHHRAFQDIKECRTESLGGRLFQCDRCGQLHYAYYSCRNRHCPKCHGKDTQSWLDRCREALLPVTYFHLVFTLPQELREIVRANQKVLLSILCRAAAYSLMKLAFDPHYVGGTIGILAVVHTWTRAMIYHPHVHLLATGGGLAKDGDRFVFSKESFLVPVTALTEIFRAKFIELARSALPEVKFPQSVWSKKWVVYSKPTVCGAERVLNYLARYVHRVAITNSRVLSMDDGLIRFRYKDSRQRMWKIMTLQASEFIRRFLQHVLPWGFHKVRYYGILAPSNRHLLGKAKELLADQSVSPTDHRQNDPRDPSQAEVQPMLCPSCKIGHLFFIGTVAPKERSPP
jgi:hypothetical protein